MALIAGLFSAIVWFSINKLILSIFNRPMSSTVLGYLIISTMAVAIITVVAVALAVAAIG